MRIKPKSGFVEVDVPIHVKANYDRQKGVRWGESMRKAREEQGIAGFGMAAGFGSASTRGRIPGPPARARDDAAIGDVEEEAATLDRLIENFDDANEKGHVMNTQTLGGQVVNDEGGQKPVYMLGAFRDNELHLTRVNGLVHMRPQFHHLDAESLAEQQKRRAQRSKEAGAEGAEPEARAVNLVVKNPADASDSAESSAYKRFLSNAQDEPWTKLQWYDEMDQESFDAYHEALFVEDTSAAAKLKSTMDDETYLDAISLGRRDASGKARRRPLNKKEKQELEQVDADDEAEERLQEQSNGQDGQSGDAAGACAQEAMDVDT